MCLFFSYAYLESEKFPQSLARFSSFLSSGLRGAVAFALVLHLQLDDEKRHVLVTSTLIIIMFTILFLGGSTLPLLKVKN